MLNSAFTQLYKSVSFYIGIKVKQNDTVLLNTGVALPRVWECAEAITKLRQQQHIAFARLSEESGSKFQQLTGQTLTLDDLRVSFIPKDVLLQAVYLDDIEDSVPAHVLVETSPGNWQGHFRLNRPSTETEAKAVIRMLRDWYGGDAGAAKPRQARRFVTANLSCDCHWDEEDINVEDAVRLYGKEPDTPELPELSQVDSTPEEISFYQDVWKRKLRSAHGDKSSADFGLALYLLQRGKSVEIATAAIRCARITLVEDKPHAEKYLRDTVAKALAKLPYP